MFTLVKKVNNTDKESEMITITEFAEQRGLNNRTVTTYIRRHQEKFEGHTEAQTLGMPLLLDDVAVEILSEKYKLPVQVVNDEAMKMELEDVNGKLMQAKELAEAQLKTISELQATNYELRAANAELASTQKLIEERSADKDQTIEAGRTEIEWQRKEIERQMAELETLRKENEAKARELADREQELAVIQKEHDTLKSMGFFSFLRWKKQ